MDPLLSAECAETVSILYAVIFGAGEACVLVSAGSILTAFAAFMVLVVLAQYVARRLWARVTGAATTPEATPQKPFSRHPDYDGGPIRSTRRPKD